MPVHDRQVPMCLFPTQCGDGTLHWEPSRDWSWHWARPWPHLPAAAATAEQHRSFVQWRRVVQLLSRHC